MDQYKFYFSDSFNVDETGMTIVQQLDSIIATKGVKQVVSLTSSERGTFVIVVIPVNVTRSKIPPLYSIPRKITRNTPLPMVHVDI